MAPIGDERVCDVYAIGHTLVVSTPGWFHGPEAWGGPVHVTTEDRDASDEELGASVLDALTRNRILEGGEGFPDPILVAAGVKTDGQLSRRARSVHVIVIDSEDLLDIVPMTPERWGWSGRSFERGSARPVPGPAELGALVRRALTACPSWDEAHPPKPRTT